MRHHWKCVEPITLEHLEQVEKGPFVEKDLEQFILTMIQVLELGNAATPFSTTLPGETPIGHIGRVHCGQQTDRITAHRTLSLPLPILEALHKGNVGSPCGDGTALCGGCC